MEEKTLRRIRLVFLVCLTFAAIGVIAWMLPMQAQKERYIMELETALIAKEADYNKMLRIAWLQDKVIKTYNDRLCVLAGMEKASDFGYFKTMEDANWLIQWQLKCVDENGVYIVLYFYAPIYLDERLNGKKQIDLNTTNSIN